MVETNQQTDIKQKSIREKLKNEKRTVTDDKFTTSELKCLAASFKHKLNEEVGGKQGITISECSTFR